MWKIPKSDQGTSQVDLAVVVPAAQRHQYQGKEQFFKILDSELDRLRRSNRAVLDTTRGAYCRDLPDEQINLDQHLAFFINTTTFQRDFLDPEERPIHSIRLTFDPSQNSLVVKMVTPQHQFLAKAFDKAFDTALSPMGLDRAILTWGGVGIDIGGRFKQPDCGWGPNRPPRGSRKRPSVVLEVGVSESSASLHRDADLWLDPARGNAKLVLAAKVNRRRPMITVEKWEWNHNHGRSHQSQRIVSEAGTNGQVLVSEFPLVIPFQLLFLREAETPRETDLRLGEDELKEIAGLVWELDEQDSNQGLG